MELVKLFLGCGVLSIRMTGITDNQIKWSKAIELEELIYVRALNN